MSFIVTGHYSQRLRIKISQGEGRLGRVQEVQAPAPTAVPPRGLSGTALTSPPSGERDAQQVSPPGKPARTSVSSFHWGSVGQGGMADRPGIWTQSLSPAEVQPMPHAPRASPSLTWAAWRGPRSQVNKTLLSGRTFQGLRGSLPGAGRLQRAKLFLGRG